jgi:hypothetical protein
MFFGRSKLVTIASVALLAAAAETGTSVRFQSVNASEKNGEPVAVVELFTSEGCSSCPPADKNLQRISELAVEGLNVIPLSFHVDYWNGLGWTDPFSQEGFSERQQDYAVAMKRKGVYTPQMIVNGVYEFNGASKDHSDKAIELALDRVVRHSIELKVADPGSGTAGLPLSYQVASLSSDAGDDTQYVLNVAVVTDTETVNVLRGENGGRKLSHVWVVKSLEIRPLKDGTGTVEVDAALVQKNHTRLVAYVQSKTTREITGASVVEL